MKQYEYTGTSLLQIYYCQSATYLFRRLKNLKSSCHGNLYFPFSFQLFFFLRVSQWEVLTNFFIFFSACEYCYCCHYSCSSHRSDCQHTTAYGMPIGSNLSSMLWHEMLIHTRRMISGKSLAITILVSSLLCVFFRHPPRTCIIVWHRNHDPVFFTLNNALLQLDILLHLLLTLTLVDQEKV